MFRESCQLLAVLLVIFILLLFICYHCVLTEWSTTVSCCCGIQTTTFFMFLTPYPWPMLIKSVSLQLERFLCYLICNQVLGNTLSNTNLLIENALISDLFLFLKGHRDRKRASIYLKSWQFIYVGKFLHKDRRRCDFLFKYI